MTRLETIVAALLAGLAAFVFVAVATELVRRFALRSGLIDSPGARMTHTQATPHLGGVAIVAGTLLTATLTIPHWDLPIVSIILAGGLVAAVGMADDIKPLSPVARLIIEILAATAVTLAGVRIDIFGNMADNVVTVLWIVVVTNSFNLLDNMDGAAGSVAAVTTSFLAAAAFAAGQASLGIFLVCTSFACIGFLVHNWRPARIFMGDTGSLYIGFAVSSSAVLLVAHAGSMTGRGVATVASLLLFTFVATVDTCVVLVSRYLAGRPLLLGGADHVSHRLCRVGLSTQQAALVLLATAGITCLTGVLVSQGGVAPAGPLVGSVIAGATLVWLFQRVAVYRVAEKAPTMELGPTLVTTSASTRTISAAEGNR